MIYYINQKLLINGVMWRVSSIAENFLILTLDSVEGVPSSHTEILKYDIKKV